MTSVLIIDDDPRYCELLTTMLKGVFDVITKPTVEEGIRQMTEAEPDAVLLDLKLPDSSAEHTETLARIKKHRRSAAILPCSVNHDPNVITELILGNASGYIRKGLDDVNSEHLACEITKAIHSQTFCGKVQEIKQKQN